MSSQKTFKGLNTFNKKLLITFPFKLKMLYNVLANFKKIYTCIAVKGFPSNKVELSIIRSG